MSEKKILVVDDEKQNLMLFRDLFSNGGYTVWSAESGEEAIEILKKENIQVMFLDLNLPGMSGAELCRQIRQDNPIACIHAVTGYASDYELVNCRRAGFDDYFIKPVGLKLLLNAARDSFEKLERWKSN